MTHGQTSSLRYRAGKEIGSASPNGELLSSAVLGPIMRLKTLNSFIRHRREISSVFTWTGELPGYFNNTSFVLRFDPLGRRGWLHRELELPMEPTRRPTVLVVVPWGYGR